MEFLFKTRIDLHIRCNALAQRQVEARLARFYAIFDLSLDVIHIYRNIHKKCSDMLLLSIAVKTHDSLIVKNRFNDLMLNMFK